MIYQYNRFPYDSTMINIENGYFVSTYASIFKVPDIQEKQNAFINCKARV